MISYSYDILSFSEAGRISLTIFHHNSNMMEISFGSHRILIYRSLQILHMAQLSWYV